jgi:putative DNA methylase
VVDDPSEHPEKWPTEAAQNDERERLFDIIRRMMGKKLHEHPEVYAGARAEMLKHCDGKLPVVFDPFAGGGSIPLEANRLGFEAHAGDLNPVAVLLNKCNLELAPRWAGRPPVNPDDRKRIGGGEAWRGTHGLAADVRYYGKWMRGDVEKRIGHLYPKVEVAAEMARDRSDLKPFVGKKLAVIAWLWARTVKSPNPAFAQVDVPLASTFILSSKAGKEAYVEPVIEGGGYRFTVKVGKPKDAEAAKNGTKLARANFVCLMSGAPISSSYIMEECKAGRTGARLMAIVAEGERGKVYLTPTPEHYAAARKAKPEWMPVGDTPSQLTGGGAQAYRYGLTTWAHLFTPRQLVALTTFSDLAQEARDQAKRDASAAGLPADEADAYARTVATFLALVADRCADFNNGLCRWSSSGQKVMNLFGRQAMPMAWDFVEANILGDSVGGWSTCSEYAADCIVTIAAGHGEFGQARQIDASSGASDLRNLLVSTDPPYYDNIAYADLSDFFYVWLRLSLKSVFPDLFATLAVPKAEELVAMPYRHGSKEKAEEHFETGFREAFTALRDKMDPRFPLTVYYAFKQDDEEAGDGAGVDLTTGWETLLEALVGTGLQITATWPVRASQKWRMRAMGANALASYIVLACRPRSEDASQTDRRSFVSELKRELPSVLRHLQQGNIAPVDFAQAAIGPGMAVYSRYARILESSGDPMRVRTALSLINQTLTEVLSAQEDEFDADTRWALAWFEQSGFAEGEYGVAETLSKAKNTSVDGMVKADILTSSGGKVRLFKPSELSANWDPLTDKRLTAWEMVHHLIRVLEASGESGASALVAKLGSNAETARELCYRLYTLCERKKRAAEALSYNALVQSWPEITRLAREIDKPHEPREVQGVLPDGSEE